MPIFIVQTIARWKNNSFLTLHFQAEIFSSLLIRKVSGPWPFSVMPLPFIRLWFTLPHSAFRRS